MSKVQSIGGMSELELRKLVPQLQSLTEKYKRSERIQKALYTISELASSLDSLERLYTEIHKIIAGFMSADNLFIAFHDINTSDVSFVYFIDEFDEEFVQTISFEQVKRGVTGHILSTAQPLVMTKENHTELQTINNFEILGTKPTALVGVPLKRGNEVLGAIVVQSYNDSIRYNDDDLEILIFISQQIITARDRIVQRDIFQSLIAQRTEELVHINQTLKIEINERERFEKLQKALLEISELSTNVKDDILDFYTKLHTILKQFISANNCYVALLDAKKEYLSFPYFAGKNETFRSTRALTRGLAEYVIQSKEAMLIDSAKLKQLVGAGEIEETHVANMIKERDSWMGAPLEIDGNIKGIIAVQTYGEGDDYTNAELDILRFVSRHISVTIERREAAADLMKYNQVLTEKVKERTAEIYRTNRSLQKQIEQRKEVELKLIHDAHHDGLTNLPNRVMFNSRLELAIASKQRYAEHNFALLFIDLDRFKSINDTLGHHAGDEFLIEATKRITACKRSHDLLARLGGDEFVILVDKFTHMSDVENIAQRINDSISTSFTIDGKDVFSGASIGVAEITSDYTDADEIMRDADAAMYQAKKRGRNRYVIFDISMRNQLMGELNDERAFREAFNKGQFEYTIQPVRNLLTDATLFYECNISWPAQPSAGRTISFWDLAEKCGLTYLINKQLMKEAFRVLHAWRLDAAYQETKIGVSLCIEHLLHKTAFNDLLEQIETSEIYSQLLVIELLESDLTRFNKYLPNMLNKLQSLGVTLVLDSFGSYSGSLNHLFKYDFDFIKLHPNLVNTFGMSDKYHRLVNAIVLIANEMEIGVIADGVDDEMILHELNEIGCHFGQGNFICPATSLK